MKRLLVVFALIICVGLPDFALAMSCPNKPSNATTLATVHFNTSDGEGQLWEIYPGAGQIQQPSGAEGNASASILAAGASTGGQQTIWPKPGAQQPLSNLYTCMRWKTNSQWVGIRTANKVIFNAAQDFTYGKLSINGFFGIRPVDTSNYPYSAIPMYWYFGPNSNTAIYNNDHTCASDFGLECNPNVHRTPIYTDTWYVVETYNIASSCTTCRNGTVKWWVDGALQGSYTNMNYGDGINNQFQLNHTWDSGFAVQCYHAVTNPNGRDCTNPQIHYFDELVIAAVGGVPAGGGGGGGTTDTTPPGQVGNVTVTQLN